MVVAAGALLLSRAVVNRELGGGKRGGATVVAGVAAVAQGRSLAFAGDVAFAEHRVEDRNVGSGVEISTGTLFGGGARVGFSSRAAITVVGRTGVLHPGRAATLPRDVAELGLDGAYRMREWLDLVGGVRGCRSPSTSGWSSCRR